MNNSKKAFTLAEVMIVLSVIGIMSAILLPVAFNSTPDKNIMKFKKAHNVFYTVIRELVNSGEYFIPGNLYKKPDGTEISGSATKNYFIDAFADVVSHKSVIRATKEVTSTDSKINTLSGYIVDTSAATNLLADKHCRDTLYDTSNTYYSYNGVTLDDGVTIWEFAPNVGFKENTTTDGFDKHYRFFCIDIDGKEGINPFAYGVRADGKIQIGARAKWWLQRDVTKKETDCCPDTLRRNGENLCDTGDVNCAS